MGTRPVDTCPIPGCNNVKHPSYLMCRKHWLSLPEDTREKVLDAYMIEQGGPEHRAAMREAMIMVLKS